MVSSQTSSFAWVMKGPSTAEVSREVKKGPILLQQARVTTAMKVRKCSYSLVLFDKKQKPT